MLDSSLCSGMTTEYLGVMARVSAMPDTNWAPHAALILLPDRFKNGRVSQRFQFYFALFLQPRGRLLQFFIAEARVAHNLAGAIGQSLDEMLQRGTFHVAGEHHAEKVLRRAQIIFFQAAAKGRGGHANG